MNDENRENNVLRYFTLFWMLRDFPYPDDFVSKIEMVPNHPYAAANVEERQTNQSSICLQHWVGNIENTKFEQEQRMAGKSYTGHGLFRFLSNRIPVLARQIESTHIESADEL